MEKTFEFTGTGGGLLGRFIVGMILTALTFGIYMPWFIVSLQKYISKHLTLKTTAGDVKFDFTGTGGGLFAKYLVGVILTALTLGIYTPWFLVNLTRFFEENTTATTGDGKTYVFNFSGTGGTLFGTFIVGYILTAVTLGIYAPWFLVSIGRFLTNNTKLMENGAVAGTFEFKGTGGQLLGTFIVGYILTLVTLGIYGFWFQVNLIKYFTKNIFGTVANKTCRGEFTGTGGRFLCIHVVGYLLTVLTLGIYGAWYLCNLMKYKFNHTKVLDA
jgi:uncharacterized membrane protein YjgN (DUF898 family)